MPPAWHSNNNRQGNNPNMFSAAGRMGGRQQGYPMQNQQRMPMQSQQQGYPMQNRQQGYPAQNQQQGYPVQNRQQGYPMQNRQQLNMPPAQNANPLQPPGMPPAGTDGVRYEPIDASTLREIKSSFAQNEQSGGQDAPAADAAKPPAPRELAGTAPAGKLELFIQNEKNANVFYRHLSGIAPGRHKKYLSGMADEAKNRESSFGHWYKTSNGKDFAAEDRDVYMPRDYRKALKRAIEEEVENVSQLSGFYESLSEEASSKKLNSMIYKKIGDLFYLNMALQET